MSDDPISCVSGITVCYEDRGVCDSATSQCICRPEYSQMTDLIKVSFCSQNILASKILYSFFIVFWGLVIISALFAIKVIHRKDERSEWMETRLLVWLVIMAILYVASGILIVTSELYGARSVGNDLTTTVLFTIATLLNWAFVIIKPTVSVTGVSSTLFSYTGYGKKLYCYVAPVMLVCIGFSSLLPFFILYSIGDNWQIVTAIYVSLQFLG
jgi:hypothetical protein